MTLFEHHSEEEINLHAPLAAKMRPRTFDDFIGQDHLIGLATVLRNAIEADRIPSMILWGPPGTGKTTLANLVATYTKSDFSSVSAVSSGVQELRKETSKAIERLGLYGQRTILFVDEIHRFNKSQQDVILPHVENGTITLIGATTENPSFEVISPLLSRSRVFTLNPLTTEEIKKIILKALLDIDHGLGAYKIGIDEKALDALATLADGDARVALNTLELASTAARTDKKGTKTILIDNVEDAMQRRSLLYDKTGDHHYDTISAFIKSIRASDPNASVYYLARMIEAGEDPMFICRRLVILAAEDVGMADPQALLMAVSAQQAVEFVGMPEGRIILSEATLYLATSYKSNSAYMAINDAISDVQNKANDPIPLHLRNPVTNFMSDIGYGEGYKYPHNYTGHFTRAQNLPARLNGRQYYVPSKLGYEIELDSRLQDWWTEEKGSGDVTSDQD